MKKILIVDDAPGWIRFHENNINHLGISDIKIDTAEGAKQALSKVESSIDEPYDVIFTDMQMESDFLPKFAGEWLIEQIQMFKEYQNSKIVIISASENIALIAKKYHVLYISKYNIRNAESSVYKNYI